MNTKRPNIILILCDQMRGDAFGAAGNPHIHTPNLDGLAAMGTRFNHAYSAVPSCLPARATLWTGQNQWHAGLLGMGRGQGEIPNDYPHTMAGELRRAGYRTHLVGKGHFHPQRASMGFESAEIDESGRMPDCEYRRWFYSNAPKDVTPDDHGVDWNSWHSRPWHTEERLHPTAWTMTRALDFLEHRDPTRPFLLNISFARPHSPYVPPAYYFSLYRDRTLPPPHVGDWAVMHDAPPREARDPNAWHGRMSEREIFMARAGYYGEISFIDTQTGRLLNWIDRRLKGEDRDNTWILFTSDHGDMQGDHHLWRKTYAYEGSARIPLLVVPLSPRASTARGAAPAGRQIADEVVELRDIMPTVLDIAGLEIPQTVDGASLMPLLAQASANWRPYIHGEHCACYSAAQEMQYVTDGRRKFIWLPRIGVEQFFDLERDPGETRNLIHDQNAQEEIRKWRSRLAQELTDRNCGWVQAGMPYCSGDTPLISPFRDARWLGAGVR